MLCTTTFVSSFHLLSLPPYLRVFTELDVLVGPADPDSKFQRERRKAGEESEVAYEIGFQARTEVTGSPVQSQILLKYS